MREIRELNSGWYYKDSFEAAFLDPGADLSSWERVELPHANREIPYNGFDEREYQFVSTYARDLQWEGGEGGRRAFLDFEGVMCACELWLGGEPAGSHLGGYTPFSIEVTGALRNGANRLVVKVDSTERPDVPPFGHVVDYLCYGGIYREARFRVQEADFIADIFARPERSLEQAKDLRVQVELDAPGGGAGLELSVALRPFERGSAGAAPSGKLLAAAKAAVSGGAAELWMEGIEGLRAWEPADPALYELEATLSRAGAVLDRLSTRVGFREAEFRPEGFFLNGRRLRLAGLNRHQSYPYVGYAMPARVQRRDAEILKRELGVNLVRTSHYPQSRHFLDACDELGLLVFEEIPGWQHIGDAAWKEVSLASLEEMIRRDRNRPGIVLWGVRINESADDRDFYARANEIAHRLDPTRQTGGVRCIEGSELLEDVYTYNDFVHAGGEVALKRPTRVTGLRKAVPYLVTEHDGHMYPTKRFDCEERLAEHAMRHARVLDAAFRIRGISGAIGWCAFDYNTHKDFGSGDRICYHGVSDMFRIPKYAAALYASQAEPETVGPVLVAASLFAKGERSAARLLPIDVYTNCEELVLYRSGERVGAFKPDRERFPGLPHPPVSIRDLIGDRLEGSSFSQRDRALLRRLVGLAFSVGIESLGLADMARFGLLLKRNGLTREQAEALVQKYTVAWGQEDESFELVGLVGGKEVARRKYGADTRYERLSMEADDAALELPRSGCWDATRVVLRALDQYGNPFPFAADCAELSVEGPLRVIGPSRVPLIGGCIAFWLRTIGETGSARVLARGARKGAPPLDIAVSASSR
jgi:beta-galactosidase